MKVLIKKLETNSDALHPDAKLPPDYENIIKDVPESYFIKPTVGYAFALEGVTHFFHSSMVMEIIEDNETSGKFKTLNSIYYWEILK